jgi:carboxypeptidase family protein
MRAARFALLAVTLCVSARVLFAGGEHSGQVTFGGLPVPGATVTATSGDKKLVTATDDQGTFNLPDATEGVWSLHVEMLGFEPLTRDVTVTAAPQPSEWTLTLRPFADITRGVPRPPPAPAPAGGATNGGASASAKNAAPAQTQGRSGFQRAGVTATPPPAGRGNNPAAPLPEPPAPETTNGSADGFLINGSVNNGAASPFAQAAAFGNNRRGRGSLYNYQFNLVEGNSALDARPFTFSGQPTTKSNYNDLHVGGTFGGPLRFSKFMRNGPNVFIGFQHADDTNATTAPGVMPTALERAGDFSQSAIQIIDPTTGKPFSGNIIPTSRISPQATSLLGLYPQPNFTGSAYNFQAPLTTFTRTDQLTSRAAQSINNRNQLIGLFAYQRIRNDQTTLFGFQDSSSTSGVDTSLTWTHRINQFITMRPRGQYTELTNASTPYFANRTDVSGLAGITGNNQDPANWGPPSLTFSTIAGLSDALPNFTRTRTYGGGIEVYWSHSRHNFTFGGDLRRVAIDIESQQNPRGAFTFNGAATGLDFADFLLGIPATSSIAFGNADKNLRGYSSDAYITDDWRFSPTLTMQLGARWEYDTPMTESQGRLVNLDIAPGFTGATPVVGSLLKSDPRGIQPRVGIAWRPVPGSSLVIRAGYGIYRNQNVYQPIITQLAQQPPFSKAYNIPNSADLPLTLANGFPALPTALTTNTFAVDPNLRIGAAQNWQALIQRDLPGSLTIVATYLGTKGTDLLQEFLPNTVAPGGVNPCPTCPSGFVFLQSDGSSSRHAGQFQLRRRLRNGLTASIQYTLAKATDNATAFAGVSLAGTAIAQDWRNLDAELAPSNFDQRHQINAQFQYTTGMGVGGGALIDGVKGKLFKGWTVTGNLITGSGLPITPVMNRALSGSGVSGPLRPTLTGASTDASSGSFLNPAAYVTPAPGEFGNAGRNSVKGPLQFTFNAGLTRTFQMSERLSVDWRIDATNVLNRLTYTGVNTILGGPQFGLPVSANTPRKIQSTIRMRF